jgi:hypothetical protein
MAWTAEDRRKDAPAIQEVLRLGTIVRLVRTTDAIDPQPRVGRERVWSTLIMLQALWHLARDGRPGAGCRPRSRPSPPSGAVSAAGASWPCSTARLGGGPCRLPPPRSRAQAAADGGGGDRRHPEREDRPAAGPARVRRRQESKGAQAGRAVMVDTEGDPLGVRVVPADVHEHRALRAPWRRPIPPPAPRCGWRPGSIAVSRATSPRPSSTPAALRPRWPAAPQAAGAFRSRSGAGRRSRPWAASSATDAFGSTTRRAARPRAAWPCSPPCSRPGCASSGSPPRDGEVIEQGLRKNFSSGIRDFVLNVATERVCARRYRIRPWVVWRKS